MIQTHELPEYQAESRETVNRQKFHNDNTCPTKKKFSALTQLGKGCGSNVNILPGVGWKGSKGELSGCKPS